MLSYMLSLFCQFKHYFDTELIYTSLNLTLFKQSSMEDVRIRVLRLLGKIGGKYNVYVSYRLLHKIWILVFM